MSKSIDLKIPKAVQDNAAQGLKLREQHHLGGTGTEVGEQMAEQLARGGRLSEQEVRHVARYFPRHAHDNLKETGEHGAKPSAGYVAWLLWGGDEGREWSEQRVHELDAG